MVGLSGLNLVRFDSFFPLIGQPPGSIVTVGKRGPKPKHERYVDEAFSNLRTMSFNEQKKIKRQGFSLLTFANFDEKKIESPQGRRLQKKIRDYLDSAVNYGTSEHLRNHLNREVTPHLRNFRIDTTWELVPDDRRGNVDEIFIFHRLLQLMKSLHEQPNRLKKCPECKYFHWNHSPTLSKIYCSSRCRNRVAQRTHTGKKNISAKVI